MLIIGTREKIRLSCNKVLLYRNVVRNPNRWKALENKIKTKSIMYVVGEKLSRG